MTDVLPSIRSADLPASSDAASTTRSRSGSIDLLRGIAIYGVVWFHCAAPYAWAGYTGLHTLTAISIYFAAKTSSRRKPAIDIVALRFHRLIVPWLFWSVLYAALLLARHSPFQPWMLLAGPSIHLWFLPYIFVVGTSVTLAARAGWLTMPIAGALAVAAIGAALAAANAALVPQISDRPPMTQWLDVAPAAIVGLAAAIGFGNGRATTRLAIATTIAFALATLLVWTTWTSMTNPRWAAGIALFFVALLVPMPGTRATAFIGRTSYGVYLSHELVKQVCLRVGSPPHSVTTAILVLIIALALTAAMERTPLRRFVG